MPSAIDRVRRALARIGEREAEVRAWAHLDPEHALDQARVRDADEPRGPLHGMPLGVKDVIDTADMPTSYGSPIYDGHRPQRDAVCVDRLRKAGAVVLGKTVTTELALMSPGPTRNPHDLARTPGGSSSGSAAAVADGMVPLALGTQTAGSVVRPASFCGVYGFKPTYGAIPTEGVKACAPSLDTVGLFARAVDELESAFAVMSVTAVRAAAAPRRVGFVRTHEWDRADSDTRARVEQLAKDAGAVDVELPQAFTGLVVAQERLNAKEAAIALTAERTVHAERCSARLLAYLDAGDAVADEEVSAAIGLRDAARVALGAVFASYDALLTPAVLGEAPEGLDATGDPLFCRMWTLLGNPCVAVPGLRGPNGLPLGVQVVAPLGEDAAALAAARWLTEQMP